MNRRDTIIVAALINTGLLAVLFMMAIHTEIIETPEIIDAGPEVVAIPPTQPPLAEPPEPSELALASVSSRDEFDQILGRYSTSTTPPVVVTEEKREERAPQRAIVAEPTTKKATPEPKEQFVEVTVKRGDYLEKIAHANGTTVGAIMRANNMSSVRINIGQVLQVPLQKKSETAAVKPQVTQAQKAEAADSERRYYTMKSGDNPWKIAKEHHVRFNELLKMNDLDEGKARNLKPGDILRVK